MIETTEEKIKEYREGQEKVDRVIKELKEQEYFNSGRYEITFYKPVKMLINRYKEKEFTKVKVKLFISTQDRLCYSFNKRRGYSFYRHINPIDIKEIRNISEEEKEKKKINRPHKAELLRNKIYPNLWPEIKSKTGEYLAENDFRESNLESVYFLNKFSRYRREQIENELRIAFDQKKDYCYNQYTNHHSGRDLKIEVKVKEDGTIRAWFSSEYKDCANGDYFLILNPKVAVFYEKD